MDVQLQEISEIESEKLCKLCFRKSDPRKYGPLYRYVIPEEMSMSLCGEYMGHYFCFLFSSGLEQRGEDCDDIKGFLIPDILREWRRGCRLNCHYCHHKFATIGCNAKRCRKSFHYPCGIENGALFQFCDNFLAFCDEHAPQQNKTMRQVTCDDKDLLSIDIPKNVDSNSIVNECDFECPICCETMSPKVPNSTIWAPCCDHLFHRQCIQTQAMSAGYFFRCPTCNNRELFCREMQLFGIFVPEQDAAWEKNTSAFSDLLYRHNSCDVTVCKCSKGRTYDVEFSEWEIIICRICGASGTHVECSNLTIVLPHSSNIPESDDDNMGDSAEKTLDLPRVRWSCESCKNIMSTFPPTYVDHFSLFEHKKCSPTVAGKCQVDSKNVKNSNNNKSLSKVKKKASDSSSVQCLNAPDKRLQNFLTSIRFVVKNDETTGASSLRTEPLKLSLLNKKSGENFVIDVKIPHSTPHCPYDTAPFS